LKPAKATMPPAAETIGVPARAAKSSPAWKACEWANGSMRLPNDDVSSAPGMGSRVGRRIKASDCSAAAFATDAICCSTRPSCSSIVPSGDDSLRSGSSGPPAAPAGSAAALLLRPEGTRADAGTSGFITPIRLPSCAASLSRRNRRAEIAPTCSKVKGSATGSGAADAEGRGLAGASASQ
jgi:hypothetical protein